MPQTRDDGLLNRALQLFGQGQAFDALLIAEQVCRRLPSHTPPAMLRAKLLAEALPSRRVVAWYGAWYVDPFNPLLQDALLDACLESGAIGNVEAWGPMFLPARCLAGTHPSLLALLRKTSLTQVGACWKQGAAIEGVAFDLTASTGGQPAPAQLTVCELTLLGPSGEFSATVPVNAEHFRLDPPGGGAGVWSLAISAAGTGARADVLLQGSPIVFDDPGLPQRVVQGPSSELLQVPTASGAPVDIVIPVYRDRARVQACIQSVLDSQPLNQHQSRVVIIDDASPEPGLSYWLDELAAAGHITLVRNRYNLGFIESTNRGLQAGSVGDVMLLNADTLVCGDWLDRLHTALYQAPDIASVTPWSNHGEISSFPLVAKQAPDPDAAELAQVDAVCAQLRATGITQDFEVPMCCGFAMLMRRNVLQQIGLLDGAALTRGYLEEVDWCLRARAAGYRHLLAVGVFVAHAGSVSFEVEKRLRVVQNRSVVAARFPDYHREYHQFLRKGPLQAAHGTLHQALLQANSKWLARVSHGNQPAALPARGVPSALPSSYRRIAVWGHTVGCASASQVLALARLLSARPELALRLLVLGHASEALWHTGVVDALPPADVQAACPVSDAEWVGLCGCEVLLAEDLRDAPVGVPGVVMDQHFNARAWLASWIEPRPHVPPTAGASRRAPTSAAASRHSPTSAAASRGSPKSTKRSVLPEQTRA